MKEPISPRHQNVLVTGPDGYPPPSAAADAVGNPGYSPLIELPSGAVLNAEQADDGPTTDGSNEAHWVDKVETADTVNLRLPRARTASSNDLGALPGQGPPRRLPGRGRCVRLRRRHR